MAIKVKTGICPDCANGKEVPLIGGKCSTHYWFNVRMKSADKKKKSETKKPFFSNISKASEKTLKKNVAYNVLRVFFLERKPNCEAKLQGCSGSSTEVHHKKGRGKYHLDESTFLAVCRSCHRWIEEHPKEAKELGFSESRLNE